MKFNLKLIFKLGGSLLGGIVALALIMFVVAKTPWYIGIPFVALVGGIGAFFGVNIKLILDQKKRENDIPNKIQNQKFKIGMKDFEKGMAEEFNKIAGNDEEVEEVKENGRK